MRTKTTIPESSPSGGGFLSSWGGLYTLLAFTAAYAAGAWLRLTEAQRWVSQSLEVAGEKLMATHDAYAFLAGAKGTSRFADEPLSHFVHFLSSVTGLSLGTVGFWLPAFAAPFAALPICLLAGRLRTPEAGLTAGVWAVLAGGFLLRTRIGYLDTDVYSLFFAVGACAGMIFWLYPVCRGSRLSFRDNELGDVSATRLWIWAVVFGLFLKLYMIAYPSGRPIVWAVIGVGGALGLILSRPGKREPILVGLAMIVSIWTYGWIAAAFSALAAGAEYFNPGIFRRKRLGLALACAFFAFFLIIRGYEEFEFIFRLVGSYLGFGTIRNQGDYSITGMKLPSVIASVREVSNLRGSNLHISEAVSVLAGNWAWFAAGLAGVVYAVFRFPLLAVFLPLLGIAMPIIGMRFSMYGGPALGLGLGFAVSDIMGRLGQSDVRRWAVQIALAAGLLFTFLNTYHGAPAAPVLSKPFAETFLSLKEISREDAVLWQWWDYGYAAQYYAERDTYGDGGRQTGEFLYPLGLVHMTTSPRQAAQVMKFMAAERVKLINERKTRVKKPDVDAVLDFYSINPMEDIGKMDPRAAQDFFNSLARDEYRPDVDIPDQYLVLAWDDLNLTGWIAHFGAWDLARGSRPRGQFSMLPPDAQFNLARGLMRSENSEAALSGMFVIMEDGSVKRLFWPNPGGLCCVANRVTGQIYVMEQSNFDSMMVQMLLGDPSRFADYFELVVDRAPWARAYKVK